MFTACLKYGGRTIKKWAGRTEAKKEKVARKQSMTSKYWEDILQNGHIYTEESKSPSDEEIHFK